MLSICHRAMTKTHKQALMCSKKCDFLGLFGTFLQLDTVSSPDVGTLFCVA
jgi:hypothetical protein